MATQQGFTPDWFKQAGDGSDDAPSIQRTITLICSGGAATNRLNLLARHYTIGSGINQPCPVLVQGQGWQEAPPTPATALGTWLDITGTSYTPWSITNVLAKGSEFRDFAVDEPLQPAPPTSGSWTPAAYPYIFNMLSVGGYVGYKHVFFDGVTNGIKSYNDGRIDIDGIFGQFFQNAISLDHETDVARIYEMHDWPYWSGNPSVIAYQQSNHIAIAMGRVDNPLLDRLVVYAAKVGIQFNTGLETGIAAKINIGVIGCDSTEHCLEVTGQGINGHIGSIFEFGQTGVAGRHSLTNIERDIHNWICKPVDG